MRFVIAILVFASIILFHEYGHYLAAKKCGVRVNEFMIGLGPRLFGIHGKETLFSVHLLPFGGACVMEGEDSESDDPRAFNNKSVFRRFLIVAAGPVFNFILAFLLSIILIACTGYVPSEIGRIKSGYPAEQAGLKSGDVITDINGYSVQDNVAEQTGSADLSADFGLLHAFHHGQQHLGNAHHQVADAYKAKVPRAISDQRIILGKDTHKAIRHQQRSQEEQKGNPAGVSQGQSLHLADGFRITFSPILCR